MAASVALIALSIVSIAYAKYQPLQLDEVHSRVGFTAGTLLFDVDGTFSKFEIQIDGDRDKPEAAQIRAIIDVASIDTDNGKRDEHLRSADFFDAKGSPRIVFTSTAIERKGRTLRVQGSLEMHGKTRSLTIPFRVATGNNGAGVPTTSYQGKVTIDRNDWRVGTDSIAAKIGLDDEVELDLRIVMPTSG